MPRVRAFGLVRGAVPSLFVLCRSFLPLSGGVRQGRLICGDDLRFLAGLWRHMPTVICRSISPAAVIKDALCHMPGKSVHLRCVILSSGVNSGSLREGENSSISYRFLTQTKAPTTRRCPS